MYSPVLSEKATRTIYRLKKVWKKPMTEIAESLIQQSLSAVDRETICKVCVAEKNNDCENCYLASEEERDDLCGISLQLKS